MRMLIIGFVVFLAACNSSGVSQQTVDSDIQTSMAKLQAQVTALQASNDALKAGQAKLTLIGKLHGVTTDAIGRMVDAVGNPLSFGPCADMGLYSGQGGSDSANPLASQFEIYKQTASGTCPGATTSYNETTGLHDRLKFAAWAQPNCQGTLYVETDTVNSMSLNALEGILVILSPDPADNTVYASQAGSVPQSIQIQSAFNFTGGLCQPDSELRMVIPLFKNDFQVSGVPDALIPGSWSRVAP